MGDQKLTTVKKAAGTLKVTAEKVRHWIDRGVLETGVRGLPTAASVKSVSERLDAEDAAAPKVECRNCGQFVPGTPRCATWSPDSGIIGLCVTCRLKGLDNAEKRNKSSIPSVPAREVVTIAYRREGRAVIKGLVARRGKQLVAQLVDDITTKGE